MTNLALSPAANPPTSVDSSSPFAGRLNLLAAIGALQKAHSLIAKVSKGQAAGGKFRYAALDDVWSAIAETAHKAGLVVVQPTMWHEGRWTIQTVVAHVPTGEAMVSYFPLDVMSARRGNKDGGHVNDVQHAQDFGALLTYARRYALMLALGLIAAGEDTIDAMEKAGEGSTLPPPSLRSPLSYPQVEQFATNDSKPVLQGIELAVWAETPPRWGIPRDQDGALAPMEFGKWLAEAIREVPNVPALGALLRHHDPILKALRADMPHPAWERLEDLIKQRRDALSSEVK